MTEFFVDARGLDGPYNLLRRAAGDAEDTLQYTRKYCDLQFPAEGLLFRFLGPHRQAYEQMTQALSRLGELSQAVGTQINRAQVDYARTDQAASARLDRSYPGATDPALLVTALAQTRPDVLPLRSAAFSDVTEPTRSLVAPDNPHAEIFTINPLTDLLSPSAWIRQVSVWLFNHDPFEDWAKQISGDWAAYERCAVAWGKIGASASGIGRNLLSGAADVAWVWRGNAAEAEQEFQLALGQAARALQSACGDYSRLYLEAAEAARHLFATTTILVGKLIDHLIVVNAAAAAGTATIKTGVGAVTGYGIAAYYAWQAVDLYQEISKFYLSAEMAFNAIAGAVIGIKAGLEVADLPSITPYQHPAGY